MTHGSLSVLLRHYLAGRLLVPGIAFVMAFAVVLGVQRWFDIQRAQDLQAQIIARYVSTYLEAAGEALNFLAQFALLDEFPSMAMVYSEQSQLFERILLLNGRGEVLHAFPGMGAVKDYSRLMPASPNSGWNNVRLSPPYLTPISNTLTVSLFGAGVGENIIVGELNLLRLQGYIASLGQIQPRVLTFITDGFGTVIAHPDQAVVEQQTNLGHVAPVSQALREAAGFLGIHRMQGAWHLFSAAKVPTGGGWLVVCAGSVSAQLLQIAVALSVFVSLLFFFLFAIAWLLDREFCSLVSSPLESFIQAMTSLEKGASRSDFGWPKETFSELGLLRQRFEAMAGAIASREQSLRESNEERLALECQLLHTQKLESLGVLAGGIAHDFNNLLAAILGNLELALMRAERDSPLYTRILQAFNAGQRATELTRQMLAYSGKGQFLLQEVNLSDLVRENAAMLQAVMAKTITLDLRLAANLPLIMADAGQIQQVALNLITNASEAMDGQPGTMTLVTGIMDCSAADLLLSRTHEKPRPGGFVFFEVRDTGCGMNEETKHRLFDPFFSTKFAGRGLGMAAVIGIIQGHRGAIFVESEPGRGSTFRVLFPALEAAAVSTQPASSREVEGLETLQAASGTGLVLVVDDEPMVRELCVEALHSFGYQALQAVDGEQGVQMFREHAQEVGCVILDLTMPKMGGIAALHEMRKIRQDIQVVLCSGYNEQEVTQRYPLEASTSFLKKPFSLKQLQAELDRMFKEAPRAVRF